MTYLLDTNVISEWVKPRPEPKVVRWLADADEDRVYMSVVSLAEIRFGVERLPSGARRTRLSKWIEEDLPERFEGRCLDVDSRVAQAWGVTAAEAESSGVGLSAMDAFFIATATTHGLTLVTRNVKDFSRLKVELLNPWA